MRVLVTNDDGVLEPGILALAAALAGAGHDVVVAAPLSDMSGSGAALGPGHFSGVKLQRLVLPGLAEVPVHGLDAPPGLCVLAGYLGAYGPPPEVVASGVNPGGNTGRSVLFSGTVGAALAAANLGLKGVAVSLGTGDPWHLDTAAAVAVAALDWVAAAPDATVLNVNVPNRPLSEVRGVRTGALAPFGVVRTVLEGESEGVLRLVLRETDVELPADTDTALVREGYVSVNALVGPRAVDCADAPSAMEAALRQVDAGPGGGAPAR